MRTAFLPADIMLPNESVDMTRWSVIACDQYTSEPEYWEKVKEIAGDGPSALSMIFPEVYLEDEDKEERLKSIHQAMRDYQDRGIFRELKQAMIYVRRINSSGNLQEGLVGAIDLECYDYKTGSKSLVRATEATVPGRLPPRVKIRENADLELPHVIMLIDDPEKTVIEPLGCMRKDMEKIYDFDLMLGGGHVSGYLLDKEAQDKVLSGLKMLADPACYRKRYKTDSDHPMVYAVGDGNHSLASAKVCYEKLKAENPDLDLSDHPARYALVELVNLHSPSLDFEPIYRIVTRVDPVHMLGEMTRALDLRPFGTERSVDKAKTSCPLPGLKEGQKRDRKSQHIEVIYQPEAGQAVRREQYCIGRPLSDISVGSLQTFLDDYTSRSGGRIDYIHGEDALLALSDKEDSIGFLLPAMHKNELFPAVIADGALPRKTFSMGHAGDKRYYTECRKIKD